MKKTFLSLLTILAFAFYALFVRHAENAPLPLSSAGNLPLNSAGSVSALPPTGSAAPNSQPAPMSAPASKPKPKPKNPSGIYNNGTYTGGVADAYYGLVQVSAVITNGRLADVRFLQYPSDNGHSMMVSQISLPILRQEAIQSQSANVNAVSGATDTSGAFVESLASALSQAKN